MEHEMTIEDLSKHRALRLTQSLADRITKFRISRVTDGYDHDLLPESAAMRLLIDFGLQTWDRRQLPQSPNRPQG
jgi:hypothetical protein